MFTNNFTIFEKSFCGQEDNLPEVSNDTSTFQERNLFKGFGSQDIFMSRFDKEIVNDASHIASTPCIDGFMFDLPTANTTGDLWKGVLFNEKAKSEVVKDDQLESTSIIAEFGGESENKIKKERSTCDKVNPTETIKERAANKSAKAISKKERFCKKHDKEMFVILTELCKNSGIDISGFWTLESLTPVYTNILKILANKINWDCYKIKNLLARIKKIGNKSKEFSAREVKLLRKLINQQKRENYTDFSAILYEFPGKSIETLRAKYNEKYDYLKKN
ncbi:unnamed protein product [Moneuplotes crassus]|uniref:Uncharacterized protein n=1 Tax=Euplotes crassus TaxID=5936 RepID=A0AAD1Y2X5_EUPCR|nr:unnamed protein product [Moneuplotes crassus]